jgi:hypothetical protein
MSRILEVDGSYHQSLNSRNAGGSIILPCKEVSQTLGGGGA